MSDKRVLVTGASGFVGLWIVKDLLEKGYCMFPFPQAERQRERKRGRGEWRKIRSQQYQISQSSHSHSRGERNSEDKEASGQLDCNFPEQESRVCDCWWHCERRCIWYWHFGQGWLCYPCMCISFVRFRYFLPYPYYFSKQNASPVNFASTNPKKVSFIFNS